MRIILILFVALSAVAYSAPYAGSGKVADILVRGSLDAYAIVYLNSFTDAGDCSKYVAKNLVILSIGNDERGRLMFSMVLAAYMADKPVKIVVDSSIKDGNGNCIIKDVRLNPDF